MCVCCWCPRKPDAFSKQYSQNDRDVEIKEYNRRSAIIEITFALGSATEIIRFFGYLRSTVYDLVAKYAALG